MGKNKSRKKTVSFFEVRGKDGEAIEEPIDWKHILSRLANRGHMERLREIGGTSYWYNVQTHDGEDVFVFLRHRDEGVSSYNLIADKVIENDPVDVDRPYVEYSVVKFISGTNKFGFVLGSNASARTASLQSYLNKADIFSEEITIGPDWGADAKERILAAEEAVSFEVVLEPDHLSAIQSSSGVFATSDIIKSAPSSLSLRLEFKSKGRIVKADAEKRREIAEIAKAYVNLPAMRAAVYLPKPLKNGKFDREKIDFYENQLTTKISVVFRGDDPESSKIRMYIEAIDAATEQLHDQLFRPDVLSVGWDSIVSEVVEGHGRQICR
ncbi:hypothetical protein FHR81_001191 [Actinoalloteichus hoggarensis]|uniref:Uncharacterized protein n=1 Tax=Actinoalloteichus hoggarensis TaxID=1470176 RepID=A0A221VZJ5_9PSEU|nr:hypothetical protein [Actinoalloteichus hoggarensis]ASO18926.1 hypothetical protein AHOG_06370 [Actinoalloteichus hoggarensis]MBB5920161.1 hypothetical protein [Actinoalloteichus hoggarensis]